MDLSSAPVFRHLVFLKIILYVLTINALERPMYLYAKFCGDRSHLCGDVAIFHIF